MGRPRGRSRPGPDAVVVVLLPDSGRGYLSKLYNDAWMADHGFLQAAGPTVGKCWLKRAWPYHLSSMFTRTRRSGRRSLYCGSSRFPGARGQGRAAAVARPKSSAR